MDAGVEATEGRDGGHDAAAALAPESRRCARVLVDGRSTWLSRASARGGARVHRRRRALAPTRRRVRGPRESVLEAAAPGSWSLQALPVALR